jgi:hypothetical protein
MQLMRRFGVDLRSLPAQIILTLVALVLQSREVKRRRPSTQPSMVR